jgi:hypothetical protein
MACELKSEKVFSPLQEVCEIMAKPKRDWAWRRLLGVESRMNKG